MAMLDELMGKLGGLDIAGLAGRVGLTEAQVQTGVAALVSHLSSGQTPDGAAQSASAETGIDSFKLAQLVPLIQQHLGGEGGIMSQLGGLFGQGEGAATSGGSAGGIGDLAKGLFGRS